MSKVIASARCLMDFATEDAFNFGAKSVNDALGYVKTVIETVDEKYVRDYAEDIIAQRNMCSRRQPQNIHHLN